MIVIPIAAVAVIIIAILGLIVHANQPPERKAARKAEAAKYCTKHVTVSSPLPGGPDHTSWVYGGHRTKGNACDGPEHRRVSSWQ
jgi:hypothetical protein